jgi:hypothetical protein
MEGGGTVFFFFFKEVYSVSTSVCALLSTATAFNPPVREQKAAKTVFHYKKEPLYTRQLCDLLPFCTFCLIRGGGGGSKSLVLKSELSGEKVCADLSGVLSPL